MRVLQYLLGVLLFCGVFLIGRWMTGRSGRWNDLHRHRVATRKAFLYVGRLFQVVGGVWAFLDAVAVLVLGVGLAF